MEKPSDTRSKVIIMAVLVGVIALLHYATPTEPHDYHKIHIARRKLYFLPPGVAAAWFGLRGAIIVAVFMAIEPKQLQGITRRYQDAAPAELLTA